MNSYSYDLKHLKRFELIEGQNAAIESNEFKNFKELGNQVKKIIHGFPKSFQGNDFSVPDMEIYLGVALPDQLYGRFQSHMGEKGHEYGIILGVSQSSIANYLEKVGIKLLLKLQNSGHLCVRNYAARGHAYELNDKIHPEELIFYYMTVKVKVASGNAWVKPNGETRNEIRLEMFEELEDKVLNQTDKKHIAEVVDGVHLASDFDKVIWHYAHKAA